MWWSDSWWDFWPTPMMFFGPAIMLIFIIVCVTMMMLMMRRRGGHRSEHALDILKERFARGEINQAEYQERRRLLSS